MFFKQILKFYQDQVHSIGKSKKKVTTFNICREKYIAFKERYQKTPLGKCIDEIMV
jgi:hypothetical protein